MIVLGCVVLAQSSSLPGQRDPRAEAPAVRDGSSAPAPDGGAGAGFAPSGRRDGERPARWFIILNSPVDLDELWRKIERPDLILSKDDRGENPAGSIPATGKGLELKRSLVESVKITGRVMGESADLAVELVVAVKGVEAAWVPIRLDNQRIVSARESGRDLDVRQQERREWQVRVTGEGEHRIRIELVATVSSELARKRLSLAIPEAASTSLELDFGGRASDVTIGANEDFGQNDPGRGRGKPVRAHLSPRSRLEVSWLDDVESSGQHPPLLTAQGEIAVEIDAQQMRTRSSWSIRCVRGTARSLELKVDDDEITEVEVDDQSMGEDIVQARGSGKLTIPLEEPLRAGASARLVMRTRRSLASSGARRISFAGFPVVGAREQTGYIGITQSPNLWVGPAAPRGLHRIDSSKLPSDLRARPATSLAYEFLNQPFLLELAVESSPAQIRGEARTTLEVGLQEVRSETTIDLTWLGELFDLELGVAPGLEVVSVGPRDMVEKWHMAEADSGAQEQPAEKQPRRLRMRLSPQARDRSKVSLKLAAIEPIKIPGLIRLGLFAFDQTVPVNAFFAIAAGRGLDLELQDDTGRLRSSPEIKSRFQNLTGEWPVMSLKEGERGRPIFVADSGGSQYLPIRVARHARLLQHETVLSARVSRRTVEVIERTTFSMRHGDLESVVLRVPAEFADRWELLDRQEAEIEELGRAADGSRRYRLSFDRAAVDQASVRFRYRLALASELETTAAREVTITRMTIEEGEAGPVRVGLELDPEIVVGETGPGWIRASDDLRAEPASERPVLQFVEEGPPVRGRPFTFKARALAQLALPRLVIPRLLIKTIQGMDGSRRTIARYWVELHGVDFPFELPAGLVLVEARIDGRVAAIVDYDRTHSQHRLRLPGEKGQRPVLIELEYQESAPDPARAGDCRSCKAARWFCRLSGRLGCRGVWQRWELRAAGRTRIAGRGAVFRGSGARERMRPD